MRILLALALGAVAGFLIWHGIDSSGPGRTEYENQATGKNFKELHRLYPYSTAAIEARTETLASQIKAHEGSAPGKVLDKDDLKAGAKAVVTKIPDETKAGISGDMPYVQPYSAAIIGLVGLLLALILPGTRFRGLAFLGLLLGAAAALSGMLPEENQVGLVNKVSAAKYVIANFPRVAQGCVALAALTLLVHSRGGKPS